MRGDPRPLMHSSGPLQWISGPHPWISRRQWQPVVSRPCHGLLFWAGCPLPTTSSSLCSILPFRPSRACLPAHLFFFCRFCVSAHLYDRFFFFCPSLFCLSAHLCTHLLLPYRSCLSPPARLHPQVLVDKFQIKPASVDAPEQDLIAMMKNN